VLHDGCIAHQKNRVREDEIHDVGHGQKVPLSLGEPCVLLDAALGNDQPLVGMEIVEQRDVVIDVWADGACMDAAEVIGLEPSFHE
jgi:hypothetical protein